ncbi:MAG: hypothetical protein ACFFFG_12935 [Candidatus Thorarchaeota archaeon]
MMLNRIQNKLLGVQPKYLALSLVFGSLFVLSVILLVFMPTEGTMASTGFTIFDFQLAWTKAKVDMILEAWTNILPTVLYQTYFDYVFIVGYILLFTSFWLLVSQRIRGRRMGRITGRMIWFAGLAGIFDAIENVFSMQVLSSPLNYSDFLPMIISSFATLKFLALLVQIAILVPSVITFINLNLMSGKNSHE